MSRLEDRLVQIGEIITKSHNRLTRLREQFDKIESDFELEDWEREELLDEIGEDIIATREHITVMAEQQRKVWKEYQDEERNRSSNQSRES
jgi:hypothetical protein